MSIDKILERLTPDTPITDEEMREYVPIMGMLRDKNDRRCEKCGKIVSGKGVLCLECYSKTAEGMKRKVYKEIDIKTTKCIVCGDDIFYKMQKPKYCPECRTAINVIRNRLKGKKINVKKVEAEALKCKRPKEKIEVFNFKKFIEYGVEI